MHQRPSSGQGRPDALPCPARPFRAKLFFALLEGVLRVIYYQQKKGCLNKQINDKRSFFQ